MQYNAPTGEGLPSIMQSGPEVVAGFIEDLRNQTDLDQGTVSAIVQLSRENSLTVTNLVKGLEEARGTAKV